MCRIPDETILQLDKMRLTEEKFHRRQVLTRMQISELPSANCMYFTSQCTSGSAHPQLRIFPLPQGVRMLVRKPEMQAHIQDVLFI